MGYGFGFGPGRASRRRGGGVSGISAPTSTFTMTQLASADRIYQRSTLTGGGQGKGQGTIPVTINASQAGTVHARCRSAADGVTILQEPWAAATIAGTGAQTLNVAGVDARLGWFYLDLLDSSGDWKLGTVPVGMGALIGISGQSLAVRMLVASSDTVTKPSDVGCSIPANARVFADWNDVYSNTASVSGWLPVVDLGAANDRVNSAGAAELLTLECATRGVNVGFVGSLVGGTSITYWVSGGTGFPSLRDNILAAGGALEDFFWYQGHRDCASSNGSRFRYDQYKAYLVQLWSDLAAAGITISGRKYVTAIPNVVNDGTYVGYRHMTMIRAAQFDWAEETGNVYLDMMDIRLAADVVHQVQLGARDIARHLHRAMHSTAIPPRIASASRTGVDITLSLDMEAGASLVAGAGQDSRFVVNAGNIMSSLALDAATPIVVNQNSITLKLAADPGEVPVSIWPLLDSDVQDGTTGAIYDDNDAEGFGVGRQLYAVPRPTIARINAPLSGGSFGSGKFGQGRSSGQMSTAGNILATPGGGRTFDFWFNLSSLPAAARNLMGQLEGFRLNINTSGGLSMFLAGGSFSPDIYLCAPGSAYHVRVVLEPCGYRGLLFVDGVYRGSHALAATSSAAYLSTNVFSVGGCGGLSTGIYDRGYIDEVAIFDAMLSKEGDNFSPPSAPWVGNEAGLLHLWHLDGNGDDSAA